MKRLFLLAGIILIPAMLIGDVPRLISYQGRLSDSGGNPVTGTHNLTFKLYIVASGGTAIWTENQSAVFSNGLYNVILGSTTVFPDSVNFSKQYWLGVSIESGLELSPRCQLSASPYALNWPDTIHIPIGKIIQSDGSYAIKGEGRIGVFGSSRSSNNNDAGVVGFAGLGSTANGVRGNAYGSGYGVYAGRNSPSQPWAGLASSIYAGDFHGDVHITGHLSSDDTLIYITPFSAFVGIDTSSMSRRLEYNNGMVSLNDDVVNTVKAYAPLNLPQNAQIVKITSYWYDTDASHDVEIQLVRHYYNSNTPNSDVITAINSSGSGGAGLTNWTGTHSINYSDNGNNTGYSYNIVLTFPTGISTSCGVRGINIKYILQ